MTRARRPTVAPVSRRLLPALAAAVVSAWGGGLDAQGPGAVRVDSVAVTGNVLMQTAPLVGTIGIFRGDTITFREVQNAEKRLWATGRFADITVTANESPDGLVALTFDVEEYPIIRERRIEGLEFVSEGSVWEEIGLEAGTPYTPQLFAEAREYIRTELAEEGIPYVQVEEEVTPVAGTPGSANLVLRVEEGQRVTIAEIAFNGNEAFPDGELEGTVSSRSEGFFWFQSGAYQAVELEEDLRTRLPQFYASHGYLDFEVLGDTLIVDPTNGKARLEIDVQEGPPVPRRRVLDRRQPPVHDRGASAVLPARRGRAAPEPRDRGTRRGRSGLRPGRLRRCDEPGGGASTRTRDTSTRRYPPRSSGRSPRRRARTPGSHSTGSSRRGSPPTCAGSSSRATTTRTTA